MKNKEFVCPSCKSPIEDKTSIFCPYCGVNIIKEFEKINDEMLKNLFNYNKKVLKKIIESAIKKYGTK